MDLSYILISLVCVIGLAIRTTYELLKKAGRLDTHSQAIFALVFVAMLLILGSWPLMGRYDPRQLDLPEALHWIGIGLVILGAGLAVGGLVQLKGLENIDHLVTTGWFSKIRHPMYTGFILWILGWVIAYSAPTCLIVAAIGIGTILFWRRLEEEKLASQFGEDYRRYRARTWF